MDFLYGHRLLILPGSFTFNAFCSIYQLSILSTCPNHLKVTSKTLNLKSHSDMLTSYPVHDVIYNTIFILRDKPWFASYTL